MTKTNRINELLYLSCLMCTLIEQLRPELEMKLKGNNLVIRLFYLKDKWTKQFMENGEEEVSGEETE